MTNSGDRRSPDTPVALSVGDVVADRYRIDAVLGEGGMGIVYRIEHLHLRKALALKVLLPEWASTPQVVARFEREAVAAANIRSPHVVAATDFGRLPSGSFFLVMEYVGGRTLRASLEAGALDPDRALHILRGIASALQEAHALGIVHRDIKPENIMLVERDGDSDFVKVLDFGIAKVDSVRADNEDATAKALTQAGTVIGTPEYMSPEQALGQPIDARSDLYSAGVILFEMLTGRCPFDGGAVTVLRQHVLGEVPELPLDITANVDHRVGAILRKLLAKLPDERFSSATELLAALDHATTSEHVPPASREPVPALVESRRGVTAAAPLEHATQRQLVLAAVAVAVVTIAIFALLLGGNAKTSPSTAVVASASTSPASLPAPTKSADAARVSTLPPPVASTSSSATAAAPARRSRTSSGGAASSQGRSRTGPGGIYIPPPSQWFK